MDPKRFYGSRNKEKGASIRSIPDHSDDSELSADEDHIDETWSPERSGSSESESSSETSDDETAEPGPSTAGRSILWRLRSSAAETTTLEPRFLGTEREGQPPQDPIAYFRDIIDDGILDNIVNESNRYSLQCDITKPLQLDKSELEQFLGIVFYMSVVKIPRARLYWSPTTRCSQVADTMPMKRFEDIKSKIHFSNNELNNNDKLGKIRPLFEAFRQKVNGIPKSERLSVDEQVVPFKGKSSLKQYNPKKPKKWGYKIFVCSGTNGLIHDLEIYSGKIQPCPGQPDLGASSNIVLRLLQGVNRGVWHKIYMDNWFNSLPLQTTLWKQGVACLGTVRVNRLKGCALPSDKELAKNGRGSSVMKTGMIDGTQVNVVKWSDNKSVTLMSTFAALEPQKEVKRFDKKLKREATVQCPSIISLYNCFMGGVDLLDMLVALYRNPIRSKKWYHRLAFHIFDLAAVQSWLLYIQDCKHEGIPKPSQIALLDFKIEIAQCLMKQNKSNTKKRARQSLQVETMLAEKKRKGPTAVVPPLPIRTDNMGHMPLPVANKGRCKFPGCKGFSRIMCEKCSVHLCLTQNSNCFQEFHQP